MGSKSGISGRTLQQRSNLYFLSLTSASYEKCQAHTSFPPSSFPTSPAKSEANADISICPFSLAIPPLHGRVLSGQLDLSCGPYHPPTAKATQLPPQPAYVTTTRVYKDTHRPTGRGQVAMLKLPHQHAAPDRSHTPRVHASSPSQGPCVCSSTTCLLSFSVQMPSVLPLLRELNIFSF